ncbi:MAG TPA: cyclic nucleotide-binding domain-containing protein [Vicinamibacteria bacterium]|nr:cyclic nucleotide-binding domain-containing protein [Vicinamibacteria bacterium]
MTGVQPDLVRGLSEEETVGFLSLGVPNRLASGQILFRLGLEADKAYLVMRGRIALTLPIQIRGGEEEVVVEEKLPGETVGWSGLVPPHRFTLNAGAAIDSELLAFSRASVLDHFAAHPAVGHTVTRNLAAVIGRRLQVFQTMWMREVQRVVEQRYS